MLAEDFAFLSVAEAAELIGVTDGRIRQLLLRGKLRGQKLGKSTWAIPRREVERYAAQTPPAVGRPRKAAGKTRSNLS